jgi:hypothetical protein
MTLRKTVATIFAEWLEWVEIRNVSFQLGWKEVW